MKLVVVESPYAGDVGDVGVNIAYAKRCVRDALSRGEAPFASHLLYTQAGILDDNVPGERALGIGAGHAWYRVAEACVVYVDRGVSRGMKAGVLAARAAGAVVEFRSIDKRNLLGEKIERGERRARIEFAMRECLPGAHVEQT